MYAAHQEILVALSLKYLQILTTGPIFIQSSLSFLVCCICTSPVCCCSSSPSTRYTQQQWEGAIKTWPRHSSALNPPTAPICFTWTKSQGPDPHPRGPPKFLPWTPLPYSSHLLYSPSSLRRGLPLFLTQTWQAQPRISALAVPPAQNTTPSIIQLAGCHIFKVLAQISISQQGRPWPPFFFNGNSLPASIPDFPYLFPIVLLTF